MGAVLVWITQHAKQLAAWSAFVVAIGALVAAIASSGIVDSIQDGFDDAKDAFEDGVNTFVGHVSTVTATINDIKTYSDSGIVEMVWYCLDVPTLVACIALIASSFSALVGFVGVLIGSAAAIGAAVWVYRKAVYLSRTLSNGQIG